MNTIPSDFSRRMLALGRSPGIGSFRMVREDAADDYGLGAKRSWVPIIGEIVWEIPKDEEQRGYYAYICKISDDGQIGYVRIPHFEYDEEAVSVFDRLIARFQATTIAVVLDQIENPGGSMFQMYALLSKLTDKPLALPQHQITITEDEAAVAADVIANADEEAPERVAYSRFVLSERAAGRGTAERVSYPVYLGGVERILPSENHYTRGIVVLINELTFSAGEFLAAILQDNARGTLFGARTAGAGGCVRKIIPPASSQQLGIAYYTLTSTIERRTNGDPILDRGVQPDVPCRPTLEDSLPEFQHYRRALLQTLSTVAAGHAPGELKGTGPSKAGAGNQASVEVGTWHPSDAQLKEILEDHQLHESNLTKGKFADLSGANLNSAELSGVNLSGATLRAASLRGANLINASLVAANLYGAILSGANLQGADLTQAYLSRAKLVDAKLTGANLQSTNLSNAELIGTDLTNANMLDTYLPGANLSGADLRGATGLSADQLRLACVAGDNTPKLPNGFELPPLCSEKREP